jgi:hypothetical protein
MPRALTALLALALFAGCGGDDEEESEGATGANGVQAAAPYDITVGEFLAELQPQKQQILKAFVADSDACAGTRVDPSFTLLVSGAAIDVPKDGPLAALVEEQCSGG